jgi:hypothetical protein
VGSEVEGSAAKRAAEMGGRAGRANSAIGCEGAGLLDPSRPSDGRPAQAAVAMVER